MGEGGQLFVRARLIGMFEVVDEEDHGVFPRDHECSSNSAQKWSLVSIEEDSTVFKADSFCPFLSFFVTVSSYVIKLHGVHLEMLARGGQCHQLLRQLDRFEGHVPLRVDEEGVILLDQGPLAGLVGGGFTGDDDVFSVLGSLSTRVGVLFPGGRVRVLSVEGDAGPGGVVEARGLLGGVVAQADGEEPTAVGAADVEGAGLDVLGAQGGLLEGDDGFEGRD